MAVGNYRDPTTGEWVPLPSQGPQGVNGLPGADGADGAAGAAGADGAPGAAGATGSTGAQGPQGDPGAAGATGPQGDPGATGAAGPQGEQGNPGLPGGGTQQSLWDWRATPQTAPVLANKVGVNTEAPGDATQLYIDRRAATDGIDWSNVINTLEAGDHVYAQHRTDATSWHRWTVTGAPTLDGAGNTWIMPVTTEGGSPQGTEPNDNTRVVVAFQFQTEPTDHGTLTGLGDDDHTQYVKKAGDTVSGKLLIQNGTLLDSGLVVERTVASTSIDDADIVSVKYNGVRQTWVNEKGNLRVSNSEAPGEDAVKITGDAAITGNYLNIINETGGATIMRVGALGRANFHKGVRLVGDTIQVRDSTEADESTITQVLAGNLVIVPKRNVSVSSKKLVSLANGTDAGDAVNKGQLDAVAGAAVTDHGVLTGLGDDDHTQYAIVVVAAARPGSPRVGTIWVPSG